MLFGVQLYGLMSDSRTSATPRDELARRLEAIGIRFVEPCLWLDGEPSPSPALWTMDEWARAASAFRAHHVSARSCHVFARDMEAPIAQYEALAREYGIRQFVFGCPQDIARESYAAYAERCKRLAGRLAAFGAELLIHNGYAESAATLDGKPAYEWLLDACGDGVGAQPDAGWLMRAGVDPEAFLWRNERRVKALHYKDFQPGAQADTAIGRGALDALACFQFARAHGIPQLLDQDGSAGDLLDDLAEGAKLLQALAHRRDRTASVLCALDADTGEVSELQRFDHIVEAPNWLPDGDTLLYNADGRLYRYSLATGASEPLPTGACDRCNNDHVVSFDGRELAVSHHVRGMECYVYRLPATGGEPTRVTALAPSFAHGWSPDGKEIAYCAFREIEGRMTVDVYAVDAAGGEERRLTRGEGFSDGPEYAPDGRHIWFNSTRSGLMQVWRMGRDGGAPERMARSERNDWFPHLSPDGKRVAYLSYAQGELEPSEHLPNMNVELWLMNADGSGRRKLLSLFGGQGSMNVNSWSPDGRRLAFVRYELEHA